MEGSGQALLIEALNDPLRDIPGTRNTYASMSIPNNQWEPLLIDLTIAVGKIVGGVLSNDYALIDWLPSIRTITFLTGCQRYAETAPQAHWLTKRIEQLVDIISVSMSAIAAVEYLDAVVIEVLKVRSEEEKKGPVHNMLTAVIELGKEVHLWMVNAIMGRRSDVSHLFYI